MSDGVAGVRLSRRTSPDPGPRPPARIVHLGLGAFHRAHQAWYTAHAADADAWGIAAFTGRSPDAARTIQAQDGLFTLMERGPEVDALEVVRSIVSAHPGSDVDAFVGLLASPQVAVLTMTVTEAGYRLDQDGLLDVRDAAVVADIAMVRAGLADTGSPLARLSPTTALGRVLVGLEGRRRSGSPAIAVVPCDNLSANGMLVGRALARLADEVSAPLSQWLTTHVSVVSTSVDRITPRPTEEDRAEVQEVTGMIDEACVVTEPFADWVLSGDFPSGRPDWESAGARFVPDIAPWESRKLWMLNGAHSALAALGLVRGHRLVHEAIADQACRALVDRLWEEDRRHLPDLDLDHYGASLLERFANPRIAHALAQIAEGATTKLRVRIVPVALAERAAGRPAGGCASALAAWILAVRQGHCPAPRPDADPGSSRELVATLDPGLGGDAAFCANVEESLRHVDPS